MPAASQPRLCRSKTITRLWNSTGPGTDREIRLEDFLGRWYGNKERCFGRSAVRRIDMDGMVTVPVCRDAVIVIPGIMGSELVDAETGDVLWGLSPRSYLRFWTSGDGLERL